MTRKALFAVGLLLIFAISSAEVPKLINYQGNLTDLDGNPVADGDYNLIFTIYDSESGGSGLWYSGSQPVRVKDGQFSYMLGSVNPLPHTLFEDTVRWLGVRVGSDPEIVPRTRLATVPYAYHALYSDTAETSSWAPNNSGWYHHDTVVSLTTPTDYVDLGTGVFWGRLNVASDKLYGGYFTSTYQSGGGHIIHAEYVGEPTTMSPAAIYGKCVPQDGRGYGGYFEGGYRGVHASVQASGDQDNYTGVMGMVTGGSGNNYAIFGQANGGSYNIAIAGESVGPGDGNMGVYGLASGATVNWAGFFDGDVRITGTLDNSKSGIIMDHPLDPENRFLCHSSVNAPAMTNIYSGNVTTDKNGEAFVGLPNYCEALNEDFRYQLTVLGDFAQAIISQEISENQFAIKTDKPYIRVSWQVTGTRKDPWAKANHTEVEIYKSGKDKGLYLHPEVYGLSPEMQINFEQNKAALQTAERSE